MKCKMLQDFDCERSILMAGPIHLPSLLSKNAKGARAVRIITYSLCSEIGYVTDLLAKPQAPSIRIIAHKDFKENAVKAQVRYKDLRIRLHPTVHSKVMLIEPDIVIVGSANFTGGDYDQTCVQMYSPDAHAWYFKNVWKQLWRDSRPAKTMAGPGLNLVTHGVCRTVGVAGRSFFR